MFDLRAGLRQKSPRDAFVEAIRTWEGGFQQYREDAGNWVFAPDGTRRLVGTNLGVTPAALARHRGLAPYEVAVEDMRALRLEEAAEIGLAHYYRAVGFDRLPWLPATEVWVDIGWGSGPRTAILHLQRLIGTGDDGVIGPITTAAFVEWIEGYGHARTVERTADWRRDFYRDIVRRRPQNGVFLRGWLNRANWYCPANPSWWGTWFAEPTQRGPERNAAAPPPEPPRARREV